MVHCLGQGLSMTQPRSSNVPLPDLAGIALGVTEMVAVRPRQAQLLLADFKET